MGKTLVKPPIHSGLQYTAHSICVIFPKNVF